MTPTLRHLTIQTGHVAETSRADVSDRVLMQLQPLIDSYCGGLVPTTDLHVSVMRPGETDRARPIEGLAGFTIQQGWGGPTLATNIVCWDDSLADQGWDMLCAPALSPVTGNPIVRPAGTPWLATTLHLDALAAAPRDTLQMLGDLERCLAWAIIETPL